MSKERFKGEPYVRKEMRHQDKKKEQALNKALLTLEDGQILTIRTFDWFRLRAQRNGQIPEDAVATVFMITFKGPVKIGRVSQIIQGAFEKRKLVELQT